MSLVINDLAVELSKPIYASLATTWSISVQYHAKEIVLYSSDYYSAISDNIGQTPSSSPSVWTKLVATSQMKTYAQAIIDTLTAGLVNNAPGTITGTAAPGGPLTLGTGLGGLISGLLTTTWISDMNSGNPGANPSLISFEAGASTGYLMASSLVNFASGNITGNCTATPTSPGILANGAGNSGTLNGLSGTPWAAAVAAGFAGANITLTDNIYNAIVSYLETNAVASYSTGSVTGTFAANGGPLVAGTGLNGTVQ